MKCSNCGHDVGDEDTACKRCGSGTGYTKPEATPNQSPPEVEVVKPRHRREH